MTSYTKEINKTEINKYAQIIQDQGLQPETTKSEYETHRYRGMGVTAIIYSSGKILLQGKDVTQFANRLNDGAISENSPYTPHIGADEVGKGDYFGPLVVAAAYIPAENIQALKEITVSDSKKLSDERILNDFPKLAELCKYSSKVVKPLEYAENINSTGNINIMLSDVHMQNVNQLMLELADEGIECDTVVIDQFSTRKDRLETAGKKFLRSENVKIVQFHKGESDIAVAAASMIARAVFLSEWEVMEKEYEFEFPKGSSNVIEAARRFVLMYGEDKLREVAKVSFSITAKVLNQ
ncbi:MAG: ribonuclease HIII [Candidatus Dojkabacteria bacterium]|nr:MAG: ribonuclease HIII [Candidatus Dojkabacteria bacterium]